MMKRLKSLELFLAVGMMATLGACGISSQNEEVTAPSALSTEIVGEGGEGGEGGEESVVEDLSWGNTFKDRQVVADFTQKVVIPNYQTYVDNTAELTQAIATFIENPSESSLKSVRAAWTTTRIAWEQTETFAFGPASALGLDGAMDAWPVNQTDVKKILADSTPLTVERIAQLQDTERGMHAIEFILFGDNNNKTIAAFTPREKEYLNALGQDLNNNAEALLASWERGVNGQPAYQEIFTTAGNIENSVYPTIAAAAQELLTGILDSLTEVGEEKLEAAFVAQSVEGLESRFSHQTINDLKSNLQSAENGYLGIFPEKNTQSRASLSRYIASRNPTLDETIQSQFKTATQALAAIPAPLENSLTDPTAATSIQAAIEAILKVKKTLEEEVVPLI